MQFKLIFFALLVVFGIKIVLTEDDFDDGGDDGDDGGGGGGGGVNIVKQCAKEFTVSREDAKGMMTGNFSAITENIQCFVKCVMIGNNLMDEDNNFNPEVFIEKFAQIFNPEKVEKSAEECEKVTGDTSCEKAFNTFKCLRQKRQKQ